MNKPPLKVIKNEAGNSAQIFIYGIIGDYWYDDHTLTARKFQQQLSALFDVPEIHVHINSPGGDVYEGLAIANSILSSKKVIHTHNDGICASMAAVILASAKKDHRHAAKGSLTMFHSASTIAWGNAEQLREDADMLEKHDEALAEIVAEAMGKTMAEIKALYFDGKDHWLTATELEKEGFLTIDDYTADNVPDNATAMKFDKIAAHFRGTAPTPQNNTEHMFGNNKFKSLSALAKVAVADINADKVKAINDEIEAEGIPGITVVLDSELETVTAEAGKVPGLNSKVKDLTDQAVTDQQTIKDLKAEVAAFGGKPAEEATSPAKKETDTTTEEKPVVDDFETSFDREVKAAFGK